MTRNACVFLMKTHFNVICHLISQDRIDVENWQDYVIYLLLESNRTDMGYDLRMDLKTEEDGQLKWTKSRVGDYKIYQNLTIHSIDDKVYE